MTSAPQPRSAALDGSPAVFPDGRSDALADPPPVGWAELLRR
jgi:hypothetical protein